MSMREIKVTESGDGAENIGYVGRGLAGFLADFNGDARVSLDEKRSTLTLRINIHRKASQKFRRIRDRRNI